MWDSHFKDKPVARPSYIYHGNSSTVLVRRHRCIETVPSSRRLAICNHSIDYVKKITGPCNPCYKSHIEECHCHVYNIWRQGSRSMHIWFTSQCAIQYPYAYISESHHTPQNTKRDLRKYSSCQDSYKSSQYINLAHPGDCTPKSASYFIDICCRHSTISSIYLGSSGLKANITTKLNHHYFMGSPIKSLALLVLNSCKKHINVFAWIIFQTGIVKEYIQTTPRWRQFGILKHYNMVYRFFSFQYTNIHKQPQCSKSVPKQCTFELF